jgi:hypothetical protein
MARTTTSGRGRKPRKAAAGAKTDAAEAAAPPEVTTASAIGWLDEIRRKAMDKGHSAAAVNAALGIARLSGLFKDKPERSPALPKFDGNYHEAARRIALLLRLGKEKPAKAEKKKHEETNGQSP